MVLLEHFVRILENDGGLLEDSGGLFAHLAGLLEHLAIILELPGFIRKFWDIRTFFVLLEHLKIRRL